MSLGDYYDEALLAEKVYSDLQEVVYEEDGSISDEKRAKSVVNIPASNGNPAYEYRVIKIADDFGYYGVAFEKFVNNESTGEIVIAHRGTNAPDFSSLTSTLSTAPSTLVDVLGSDLDLYLDKIPGQLKNALSFHNSVVRDQGQDFEASSIKQVGHSLGGALAKLVALSDSSQGDVVTFNGPDVGQYIDNLEYANSLQQYAPVPDGPLINGDYYGAYDDIQSTKNSISITNINNIGDLIGNFGESLNGNPINVNIYSGIPYIDTNIVNYSLGDLLDAAFSEITGLSIGYYHSLEPLLEYIKSQKTGDYKKINEIKEKYKQALLDNLKERLGEEIVNSEEFEDLFNTREKVDYVLGLEYQGDSTGEWIIGTDDSDIINAGGGNDVLYAGSGNDELYGGDGDDYLNGGRGHDKLYGGRGDDSLDAGRGLNKLYGGFGNDNYHLSFANYTLNIIYDNSGTDRLLLDNRVSFNQNYSIGDNGFLENFASGYTAEYRNNNLKITKIDTQSETVIREFESGQFGIYLIDEDNDEDMNTDDNGDASGGIIDGLAEWAGVEGIDPESRAASQIYGNAIGELNKLSLVVM